MKSPSQDSSRLSLDRLRTSMSKDLTSTAAVSPSSPLPASSTKSTHVLTRCIKTCCGPKCYSLLKTITPFFNKLLHVDPELSYTRKIQRYSILLFQIFWLLFLFALSIFLTFFNRVEPPYWTNSDGGLSFSPQWVNNSVCLVILIILFVLNVNVSKYGSVWSLLTLLVILENLDFSLLTQHFSVFINAAHVMSSLLVWVSLLGIPSTVIKITFTGIFVANNIMLMVMDIINRKYVTEAVMMRINDNYIPSIIITYFNSYFPTYILVGFFYIRLFTEIKYLKKKSRVQKKKLEMFDGIDMDEIRELKASAESNDSKKHHARLKINKSLFIIQYSDITHIITKISPGVSGSIIYKVTWQNITAAYKLFKLESFLGEDMFRDFENELTILASVNHKFILRFYGACLHSKRVGLLMEYCEHKDMYNFLRKFKKLNDMKLVVREKVRMLKEVASAMIYLHEKGIIHRDIKLGNILVTKTFETRLMDFGISKIVTASGAQHTQKLGTSFYMAP